MSLLSFTLVSKWQALITTVQCIPRDRYILFLGIWMAATSSFKTRKLIFFSPNTPSCQCYWPHFALSFWSLAKLGKPIQWSIYANWDWSTRHTFFFFLHQKDTRTKIGSFCILPHLLGVHMAPCNTQIPYQLISNVSCGHKKNIILQTPHQSLLSEMNNEVTWFLIHWGVNTVWSQGPQKTLCFYSALLKFSIRASVFVFISQWLFIRYA